MVNTASSPSQRLGLFVRELPSAAQPSLACYAIRTAPRAERAVLSCLRVLSTEPHFFSFFPRYVFGRFHPSQASTIHAIRGVEKIISFAQLSSVGPTELSLPAPVNEEELFAVQTVANCLFERRMNQDQRLALSPAPFPAEGFEAEIRGGPLNGLRGRVCGPSSRPFLVLSLSILQRSIAVQLDPAWVWPLGPVI